MSNAPSWWQQSAPSFNSFTPLSMLYGMGQKVDATLRRKRQFKAPVPVISVGNITVGGSGKTPLVALLAEHFAAQGELVAILSRGYGGSQKTPYRVTKDDAAARVGDEPKMLAHLLRHTSAQVWVGRRRSASAKRAITAGATLLILDDGFQHHQLHRDVDLVVLDGQNPFGNGQLLPAGPLREPKNALRRAHAVVVMNSTTKTAALPCTRFDLTLAADKSTLDKLKEQPLIAFAGIGRPEKFFDNLKHHGLTLFRQYSFADHHRYSIAEVQNLLNEAKENQATLVTTEKDAARLPAHLREKMVVIPASLDGSDTTRLFQHLDQLVNLSRR